NAVNVPAGSGGASGSNNVLGYADVKDSGGITGLAFVDIASSPNVNNISRFVPTNTLMADTDFGSQDYTTAGNSGTLDWTNGGALTSRAVNSLTIDATGNSGQTTHMG